MQKGFGVIYILIGILILAGIIGGAFFLGKQTNKPGDQKACTLEAKICPDGSGVGRTGPNCEFDPCPVIDETTNWKTYTTSGQFGLTEEILKEYPTIAKGNLKFKYPSSWQLFENKASFTNQKKYGVFLGVNLIKDHPDYKSLGEVPAENSAFIDFKLKVSNLNPDQLVDQYSEEFGEGSTDDQSLKQQIFNGYKAAKIMRNQPLPHAIVFSVSPTTVMDITIDFYDNNQDKKYSETTIKEINSILDSIVITPY